MSVRIPAPLPVRRTRRPRGGIQAMIAARGRVSPRVLPMSPVPRLWRRTRPVHGARSDVVGYRARARGPAACGWYALEIRLGRPLQYRDFRRTDSGNRSLRDGHDRMLSRAWRQQALARVV